MILGLAASLIVVNDADFPGKPKPLNEYCVFEWKREWRSFVDKDVEHEMEKQFTRSCNIQLRRPSPQMNEEQLKQLHQKYWQEGRPQLYKTRLAIMGKPSSPKLFIAVSLPIEICTPQP